MAQRIIIVGAGLIGAAIADALAGTAQVSVIEAGVPATAASGRSFGWLNASFYLDPAHFAFRAAGLQAHRDLALPLHNWCGALAWDADSLKQAQTLTDWGYPLYRISRAEVRALEPALHAVPQDIVHLPDEGCVDAAELTHTFLARAADKGAQLWTGCAVTRLTTHAGRVTGVETAFGPLNADLVILAAGTATQDLLAPLDVTVPLVQRPGLILRTRPQKRLLSRIIVTPEGEFRQAADGSILMPAAAGHQGDAADAIVGRPDHVADAALDRLRQYLPQLQGGLAQITAAQRPVPLDGLPVIGPVAVPGAYVAVLHSGVTLAAITARLVAQEVSDGQADPLLRPYRPARFGINAE